MNQTTARTAYTQPKSHYQFRAAPPSSDRGFGHDAREKPCQAGHQQTGAKADHIRPISARIVLPVDYNLICHFYQCGPPNVIFCSNLHHWYPGRHPTPQEIGRRYNLKR
jgi:hypothetical protein